MPLIDFHSLRQRKFSLERWKTCLNSLMAPLIYNVYIKMNALPAGRTCNLCINVKLDTHSWKTSWISWIRMSFYNLSRQKERR